MSMSKDEARREEYLDKHPTLEVCEECNRIVHYSDMRYYGYTARTMGRLCERCVAYLEANDELNEDELSY